MLLILAIIVGILAAAAGLWGFAFGVVAFAVIARRIFFFLLPLFIILLLLHFLL